MTAATLGILAREMDAAFSGRMVTVTKSERIVELGGAQWVGIQPTDDGPLVMFRDPLTCSTLALFERSLTVTAVENKILASRAHFRVRS